MDDTVERHLFALTNGGEDYRQAVPLIEVKRRLGLKERPELSLNKN